MDQYQQRYLAHQKRKKAELTAALKKRHSCRVFDTKKALGSNELKSILDAVEYAPSSCDRKGVRVEPVRFRDNKELLGGILVGGVGWIHRADTIFLLLADNNAYKENLTYMPFLDAGFLAQNVWIACTLLGLGCAYVNPNIREENKQLFTERFLKEYEIFCGALAIGYEDICK